MMKRLLVLAMLSVAAAGCSSGSCQNLVHPGCDIDGGIACPAHQSCVSAQAAVDPCMPDAGSCCFQVCSADSDCPSGLLCTSGVCAQGRCI